MGRVRNLQGELVDSGTQGDLSLFQTDQLGLEFAGCFDLGRPVGRIGLTNLFRGGVGNCPSRLRSGHCLASLLVSREKLIKQGSISPLADGSVAVLGFVSKASQVDHESDGT